jgi:unsaturated chondroitin disaccharide hydrolase
MVKDILSLSISYQLYDDEKYAEKAVQLLDVWFVNEETSMLPDVIYGQVERGPGEWKGKEEGILDTRLYVSILVYLSIYTHITY